MVHLIITASCFFQYSDDFAFFAMTSLMFLVYVPILCGTNLWHYRMLSIQKINTLKFPWKVIHAHKIHYQASSGYANSCMPAWSNFPVVYLKNNLKEEKIAVHCGSTNYANSVTSLLVNQHTRKFHTIFSSTKQIIPKNTQW